MSGETDCPHCGGSHPADAQFCPVTGTTLRIEKLCPRCQRRVQPEWLACPHCGRDLPQPFDCPRCGRTVEPGWKACPHCGQRVDRKSLQKAAAASLSPEEQEKARVRHKRRRRILAVSLSVAVPGLLLLGAVVLLAWLRNGGSGTPLAGAIVAAAPPPVARWLATPTLTTTPTRTAIPTRTATRTPAPTRTATITPSPTPTPGLGPTEVSPKDGMVLLHVPAGGFLRGSADSDDEAGSDEKPQRTVYLDAFWIDRTEVTNAMFAVFVDATGHETDAEKAGWSVVYDPSSRSAQQTHGADWRHPRGADSDLSGLGDHPVVHVTWNDAAAYCEWAGRRLPTEAEWEKAARGTDGLTYPWGNEGPAGNLLNFADRNLNADSADQRVDDGYEFTAPVGRYPAGASPYGALDMAGNVWEWVADWAASDYYAIAPSENPAGPVSGAVRVLRGGSWGNVAQDVRAANRLRIGPVVRNDLKGFRCARGTSP